MIFIIQILRREIIPMRVRHLTLAIVILGLMACMTGCAGSKLKSVPNGSWDEDIGYAYFKGYSASDIAHDIEGQHYIKNQILITAGKDLTFKEVSEIASRYNAEVVGYLEVANDYQIEIQKEVTSEELLGIVAELKKNPDITDASLNTILNGTVIRQNVCEPAVKIYYETPDPAVSLDGYRPYAILYLTYGTDYENHYGDVSGVILFSDGCAVRYKCPSDLQVMYLDEEELISNPETLAEITSLLPPDMKMVDGIFTLMKNINPNTATKVSKEIPSSDGVIPALPMGQWLLWGYYVNSDGEYQRLLLDSKGSDFYSLVDPNSEKICTWFFEQQSVWDFSVYTPPLW